MVNLPSKLPEKVADDEELARFLFQKDHFSRQLGFVKASAFLPNPKDGETSVSRHGAKPSAGLWKLGKVAAGDRTLYGAAILKASDVSKANLSVVADEPPERHAVIKGWPWDGEDDIELKARRKALALDLATAAGKPHFVS